MPFAKVNDIDIYYKQYGEGPPLVLISGFGSNHLSWTPMAKHLQNQFQVTVFDNRGSGQTTAPPPPYTIEAFAQDTVSLMDHLGIQQATIAGCSMGTAITQAIAYHHPTRITGGILITPFAKLPATSLFKLTSIGKLMQAEVPEPLVIETAIPWLFSCDFVSSPEKVTARIEKMMSNPHPQPPMGYLGQMTALQSFNSSPYLEKLQTEFLLLAGEEDVASPLKCAELLHQKLPRSTLHTFPQMGHMIHEEREEEVATLIREFAEKPA